ncbi:MAG: hypothetical protein EBR18_00200, partial [Betaproteobacteria bacterium]|nr:hypothetical protein [Betaproteobacteria bacterium]
VSTTGTNAGVATDYDLSAGTHKGTITAKTISLAGSRAYNGDVYFLGSDFGTISTGVNSETLTLNGSGYVSNAHVAAGQQTLTLDSLELVSTTGTNAGVATDYDLSGSAPRAPMLAWPPTTT